MWFSGPTLVVLVAVALPAAANQLPPIITATGLIAGADHQGRPLSSTGGLPPPGSLGSLQLDLVGDVAIMNGFFGVPFNATGDVDGDEVDELVIETAYDLHVYEADGVGSYVEIASLPQPTNLLNGVICADGDRDGIDEIYWEAEGGLGAPPTLIYERRETTAAGEPAPAPAVAPGFLVAPNPFAFETVLSGEAIGEGEAVGVYDLNGRRVHTLAAEGAARIWDGRDAAGRRLAPGIYFLRMGDAEHEAQVKVVLLPD